MTRVITLEDGRPLAGDDLKAAVAAVKACKIVVFPTDTVYGLGSNGLVKAALRRLYEVKGRDSLKPLPILIHSVDEAKRWVEWTPAAEVLARKFWPGPVTLVLKPTKEGRLLTFQEFPTLAVRVPAHPAALSLIEAAGVPLVSTSANPSGKPATGSGAEAAAWFQGKVEVIIDAGAVSGKESTLVDASGPVLRVLREGAVTRDAVLQAAAA